MNLNSNCLSTLPFRNLERSWLWLLAVVAACVLCGCEEKDVRSRVKWSPDGRAALVVASDGVHLADADGQLSPVLFGESYPICWMPDSSHVVACRHEEEKTWGAAAQYLPRDVQEQVAESARKLRPILLAHTGDWNHWSKEEEEKLKNIDMTFSDAVMVYLRDYDDGALKKEIGDKVPEFMNSSVKIDVVQLYRMSAGAAQLERVLYRTAASVKEIRPSSNGKAVAVVEGSRDATGTSVVQLMVLLTAGGAPVNVARGVARFPDWSADGKALAYIEKVGSAGSMVSGSLRRRAIFDGYDRLLKEPGGVQELAVTAFDPYARVRCLKDGRIVFSSAEVSLPAAPDSQSNRSMLFCVDPKYARPIPLVAERFRYWLGDQAEFFAVSPDGRLVAVVCQCGEVYVLDVGAAKLTEVQARELDSETYKRAAFMPDWRSNDELTFCGPPGKVDDGHRIADVVMYSISSGKGRSLSDGWPAEARAFLNKPETPQQRSGEKAK